MTKNEKFEIDYKRGGHIDRKNNNLSKTMFIRLQSLSIESK